MDEKLVRFNEHWLIMKQAVDRREDNLVLIQTCAERFWIAHQELLAFIDDSFQRLTRIDSDSKSCEDCQRLRHDLSERHDKFKDIFEQHSAHLLELITSNENESNDIRRCLDELRHEWNRLQVDVQTCEDELERAGQQWTLFNTQLKLVTNWFDDVSLTSEPVRAETTDELERIRSFKEHLDCKYLDLVHLKQDYQYIDMLHLSAVDNSNCSCSDQVLSLHVEDQLNTIDCKWTQLNGRLQEQ
jgi:chromosome segregation ATPase